MAWTRWCADALVPGSALVLDGVFVLGAALCSLAVLIAATVIVLALLAPTVCARVLPWALLVYLVCAGVALIWRWRLQRRALIDDDAIRRAQAALLAALLRGDGDAREAAAQMAAAAPDAPAAWAYRSIAAAAHGDTAAAQRYRERADRLLARQAG